jgi:hypothetical protein
MITERYHDLTDNPDSCQGFSRACDLWLAPPKLSNRRAFTVSSQGAGASGVESLPLSPGGGGLAAASRQTSKATSRDFRGGPEVLHLTILEDVDGAADLLDDRQIMGDEDHRHVPLGDRILQKRDDFGLNGHVER